MTAPVYGDVYGDSYGSTGAPAPPVITDPTASPVVHIGFTTDPTVAGGTYLHWSDPQRGLWDVGLWAPDDVFTDVTPWLHTFTFRRGATRVEGPVLRYEAGTATIVLDNTDGRFNPLNLAGPYVSGDRSQVRPMVPVRIGVAFGGDVAWQFYGHADAWDITYPLGPDYSMATLTATDPQKILSRRSRRPVAPVGGGELPGARVHRILDSIGWPVTDRLVDVGETPLQATTLEGDAWTELLLVQDTEIGSVYFDALGKLVFKGRYAHLEEPDSNTSQGIFGSDIAGGELPHAGLTPAYDDTTIRNVARITRVGGVEQEARDEPSIAEFLEATHERSDLIMQTDAAALAYAQYLVATSKDPELVFSEIAVDPRAQPLTLFPQVLGRDFGHRITVRSRPPGMAMVERDSYIRGIAGTYGGTNRWGWSWPLQPADATTYLIWDVGQWGQGAWSF